MHITLSQELKSEHNSLKYVVVRHSTRSVTVAKSRALIKLRASQRHFGRY